MVFLLKENFIINDSSSRSPFVRRRSSRTLRSCCLCSNTVTSSTDTPGSHFPKIKHYSRTRNRYYTRYYDTPVDESNWFWIDPVNSLLEQEHPRWNTSKLGNGLCSAHWQIVHQKAIYFPPSADSDPNDDLYIIVRQKRPNTCHVLQTWRLQNRHQIWYCGTQLPLAEKLNLICRLFVPHR